MANGNTPGWAELLLAGRLGSRAWAWASVCRDPGHAAAPEQVRPRPGPGRGSTPRLGSACWARPLASPRADSPPSPASALQGGTGGAGGILCSSQSRAGGQARGREAEDDCRPHLPSREGPLVCRVN